MSSVCIKERLTDCGVVAIHVLGEPLLGEPLLGEPLLGEPLLGHGLLIELDVCLCEEVVLGLVSCEGEVIVIRHHLLGESAQRIYFFTSGKLNGSRTRLKIEKRRKVKLMKRSRKSERTLNSCMRHGDDHGME